MKKSERIASERATSDYWRRGYQDMARAARNFARERDDRAALLQAAVERIDEKDVALRQMGAVIEGLRESDNRAAHRAKEARLNLSGLTSAVTTAVERYGYKPTLPEAAVAYQKAYERGAAG